MLGINSFINPKKYYSSTVAHHQTQNSSNIEYVPSKQLRKRIILAAAILPRQDSRFWAAADFFSHFSRRFFGFFFFGPCFWCLQGASAKKICRFGERSGGKPKVLARYEQGWSGILDESKKKGGAKKMRGHRERLPASRAALN